MEAALAHAIADTVGAFIVIMGGRFLIRESLARTYCKCSHEYNEHNIVPKGRGYAEFKHSDETCKECSCKKWNQNEKDKRNTPPVKFW